MFREFINYLQDEDGQTSTEYILLVAVVAMIVFKFREIATKRLETLTEGIFDKAGNDFGLD
jgi:pilus assembly protein Flp/PilA